MIDRSPGNTPRPAVAAIVAVCVLLFVAIGTPALAARFDPVAPPGGDTTGISVSEGGNGNLSRVASEEGGQQQSTSEGSEAYFEADGSPYGTEAATEATYGGSMSPDTGGPLSALISAPLAVAATVIGLAGLGTAVAAAMLRSSGPESD